MSYFDETQPDAFWADTARREQQAAERDAALAEPEAGEQFDDGEPDESVAIDDGMIDELEQAERFIEAYNDLAELEATLEPTRAAGDWPTAEEIADSLDPRLEVAWEQAGGTPGELAERIRTAPEGFDLPASIGIRGDDGQVHEIALAAPVEQGNGVQRSVRRFRQLADEMGIIARAEDRPATAEPASYSEEDESFNIDAALEEIDQAIDQAELPPVLTPEQLAAAADIQKRTAVFELTVKNKGFTHKVDPRVIVKPEFQETAEAAMLRASKKDIVCNELDEITRCIKKFKKNLDTLCCPTDLLGDGKYLFPLRNADAIEALYGAFKIEHRGRVRAFALVYFQQQARAQRIQGTIYNSRHYPPLAEVISGFRVDRRYLVFDAPAATEEIKAVAFRQASEQIRAQVAEAGVEMIGNLRAEAADYIQWFTAQLGVDENGKRKSVADEKYARMVKFFEMAGTLNVAGDAEFERVLEMGKAVIAGRDVAEFKAGGKARASADELRAQTAAAFEKIQAQTKDWVVERPTRTVVALEDV